MSTLKKKSVSLTLVRIAVKARPLSSINSAWGCFFFTAVLTQVSQVGLHLFYSVDYSYPTCGLWPVALGTSPAISLAAAVSGVFGFPHLPLASATPPQSFSCYSYLFRLFDPCVTQSWTPLDPGVKSEILWKREGQHSSAWCMNKVKACLILLSL